MIHDGPAARGRTRIGETAREAPLLGPDEAAETVRALAGKRGLRVGFTNGCFDILHQGHVNYLNRARDFCDRLIVAVNADDIGAPAEGRGTAGQ